MLPIELIEKLNGRESRVDIIGDDRWSEIGFWWEHQQMKVVN